MNKNQPEQIRKFTTVVTDTGDFETIREFEPNDVTMKEPVSQLLMWVPGWKRVLDLTLIVLTYPIWLPLMLLLMAASRISSTGPIFYRQERVGFRGRIFMIFKFRSMKVHVQTSWHEWYFQRLMRDGAPMTKLDAGDSRILPWGRFLRATGLDELPQIFNVLRGEMSLVGPRPCTRLEFENMKNRSERVNAPPGLTGYWQVNGKNRTTFQQMIEMDLFYAKNASVSLDLWIMAKTPAALFAQTLALLQQPAIAFAKLSARANSAGPPAGRRRRMKKVFACWSRRQRVSGPNLVLDIAKLEQFVASKIN